MREARFIWQSNWGASGDGPGAQSRVRRGRRGAEAVGRAAAKGAGLASEAVPGINGERRRAAPPPPGFAKMDPPDGMVLTQLQSRPQADGGRQEAQRRRWKWV